MWGREASVQNVTSLPYYTTLPIFFPTRWSAVDVVVGLTSSLPPSLCLFCQTRDKVIWKSHQQIWHHTHLIPSLSWDSSFTWLWESSPGWFFFFSSLFFSTPLFKFWAFHTPFKWCIKSNWLVFHFISLSHLPVFWPQHHFGSSLRILWCELRC